MRMATISEALAIAFRHHQAGRLADAEQIYRQLLAVEPEQADALHLLGLLSLHAGQHAAARDLISRALAVDPSTAIYHSSLGEVYRALGQLDQTAACYRRAILLRPDLAELHNNLGTALRDRGELDEAAACYRRALELNPGLAPSCHNLGVVLQDQGDLPAAVACYQAALELRPDDLRAQYNLGVAWEQLGRLDDAAACYRRIIERSPHDAEAHKSLGYVLRQQGKIAAAAACFRRAVELKPDYAQAYNNLGNTCMELGQPDEAVACYRRALELEPDFAEVYSNLGNVFHEEGNIEEALACCRRAVELQPAYAKAHNHLGNALMDQGRVEEADAAYRQALAIEPGMAVARSNLLLCQHYRPGTSLARLADDHAEWNRRHAAPLAGDLLPHANRRDPDRVLRLGLVSADFRRHPVGYFLVRPLESLPRAECRVYCYSTGFRSDPLTARIQAAADVWRPLPGMSDERLAQQIRDDQIDILFDLAGHTAHNRLLTFARKPAPIQITWMGYVGTTGLSAMDYILADRYEIPPQSEVYYCERVLRMPDGYVCYDPPADAPGVSPLPALEQGSVCFASFNNPAKITPQVIAVWAAILKRVPGSRLVLTFRGLDRPAVAERFLALFAAEGIEPSRVELSGWSTHLELLAQYQRVDLALDPWPYNGGLTTCEALWMGVPVVTCPGETFAGRHALAHLSNVGLTETIAADLAEYADLAVTLAGDLPRLAAIRSRLRSQMAAGPLCDGPRFAAQLMRLLRGVWKEWVASPPRV
jgi:predicted O-linked N-acetylglucosamine transferase (SPINDLY family)